MKYVIPRLRSSTKTDISLMNQTMFLKFILFNQDMFRMNHHPSSVVQNKMKYVIIIMKCTPLSHNVARGRGGTPYKGQYVEVPQKGVLF